MPEQGRYPDVCRICGGAGGEVFTPREMMFGLRKEFVYFQCSRCRCLQIRDIPVSLAEYYPDNYYSMHAKLPEPNLLARALWRVEGRLRLAGVNPGRGRRGRIFDWMRGSGAHARSAILDVGCGRGKLLHELQLFGFEDLTGADPFVSETLRYESGIVVHKCELGELRQEFDLIMMHHTFEHLPHPHATLAAARERLLPGKFLLLRIPMVDCYAWKKYGVNWLALDAPRHLYLHTEASLRGLAERAGFAVTRVDWDSGAHQFWGSEQYARDIPLRSPQSHHDNPKASLFSRREIAGFERQSRELNRAGQGDSACFYLQRQ